jgi:hypothetical protein
MNTHHPLVWKMPCPSPVVLHHDDAWMLPLAASHYNDTGATRMQLPRKLSSGVILNLVQSGVAEEAREA